MRNLFLLIAVSAIPFLPACKKVKENLQTDVDINYKQATTVPAANLDTTMPFPSDGLWLSLPTIAIPTMHDEKVTQNDTKTNLVTAFNLQVLRFQFQDAAQSFNFLDSVQVFISAPGEAEQFAGYINKIPVGQDKLDLATMSGINFKDHFLKDTIYYRVMWHVHAMPPTGKAVDLSTTYRLLAKRL